MSEINLYDLPYFVVDMPYTDQGLGPAVKGDIYGGTRYEIWDCDFTTVARYETLAEAMEAVLRRSGVVLAREDGPEVACE